MSGEPVIQEDEFYDIEDLEEKSIEIEEPIENIPPVRMNAKKKKRRTKADPLETKMDLSGKFGFSNLLRSNLEKGKEVNAISRDEFPQQEDVKIV